MQTSSPISRSICWVRRFVQDSKDALSPLIGSGSLPLLGMLTLAVIAWPLIPWYGERLHDEAAEPLGLVALLAAIVLLWKQRASITLHPMPLFIGSAALLVLRCFHLSSFPMIMGLLVVMITAFALRTCNGKPGIIMLMILSLPLMESLDFFGGYPLRLTAAEIARTLLNLLGMDVMRAGALLRDGLNLVGVDPPCAGIRMLWTSWFVSALLAARLGFGSVRAGCLLMLSTLLVVFGNSLRAVILFFPESGRVRWPHWTHEVIGLAVHGLLLWSIFATSHRLADTTLRWRMPQWMEQRQRIIFRTAAASASLILLLTIVPSMMSAKASSGESFAEWPSTLDGVALVPEALTERELRFAKGFPGTLARFHRGDDEVILRRVTQATRRLHSNAECLKASGWNVRHRPVTEDKDGRVWGTFSAGDGSHEWLVKERIVATEEGRSFTDVSAWIWDALWHPERGPWLAITVMTEPPRTAGT